MLISLTQEIEGIKCKKRSDYCGNTSRIRNVFFALWGVSAKFLIKISTTLAYQI
jgi:hypothetical protein